MTRFVIVAAVAVLVGGLGLAAPANAATFRYANCTKLNRAYPHGVARPGATDKVRGRTKPVTTFVVSADAYRANARLDADKDGVACERR